MQALGGKLVALKQGGTLSYVHQDHLTGTSLTAASGNVVDQIKYMPWGSTRSGDIASTEKKFTGQRLDGTEFGHFAVPPLAPGRDHLPSEGLKRGGDHVTETQPAIIRNAMAGHTSLCS